MSPDHDAYYRILEAHDARFDGRVFIGVHTTGIYCRPICPARIPKQANVSFYPTAAAAQEAGFRSCLRCRPECAPEIAIWRGKVDLVGRALALIDIGHFAELADRLCVSDQQLRRLLKKYLGASPVAVALTRRILFAKQLVVETAMPMNEIAQAAGFGNVRQFNAAFQKQYHRPPSQLRSRKLGKIKWAPQEDGVELFLPFSPPYNWPAMAQFLKRRAIPGVELVDENDRYHRSIVLGGFKGTITVGPKVKANGLKVTVRFPAGAFFGTIIQRVRLAFDVTADSQAIDRDLSKDQLLAPLIAARPGLRVPGTWDGFELAVRATLGQQITVTAATKLAGKLVSAFGEVLNCETVTAGLTHTFPSPERLATSNIAEIGMPPARAAAVIAIANAVLKEPDFFGPARAPEEIMAALVALPGIGPWTAEYIAMRALSAPDGFPSTDVALRRAMEISFGRRPTPTQLIERATPWRPWRTYAALHLWSSLSDNARTAQQVRRPNQSLEDPNAAGVSA